MSPFNTSKYRSMNKAAQKPTRDVFSRTGGRLGKVKLNRRISRLPLSRIQQEHVKAVMAQFDYFGSAGVTRAEFHKGLDEMARNQRDPVTRKHIERIKKHF